jgi:hypothetical protein
MAKQIFYKLSKDKLIQLNSKEIKKFVGNDALDLAEKGTELADELLPDFDNEAYFSVTFDRLTNQMIVYVWTGRYSVAITETEINAIKDLFRNKKNIIEELIARGV